MRSTITAGDSFGRLTVLYDSGQRRHKAVVWECLCQCGNRAQVSTNELRKGDTRSCGCLQREKAALSMRALHDAVAAGERIHSRTVHAMHDHPLYETWQAMRQRCNNPNASNFNRYGARGIRVCPQWDSFPQFVADVGPKPTPSHTLDRIDNDGNYEPGNVRWATPKAQAANRRPRSLSTTAT